MLIIYCGTCDSNDPRIILLYYYIDQHLPNKPASSYSFSRCNKRVMNYDNTPFDKKLTAQIGKLTAMIILHFQKIMTKFTATEKQTMIMR